MKQKLELSQRTREAVLLATVVVLVGAAGLLPPLAQFADYHAFADQRAWGALQHAMDVLSNLPFALWGGIGLVAWWRASGLTGAERQTSGLFFVGLLVTAAGSAWYHLAPDDASLVIDRGGMSVAFAGLMGLALATRVSERSGQWAGGLSLALGLLSVWFWRESGNLTPWAVYQFGGMALMLGLLAMPRLPGALAVHWLAVLLVYGLAKGCELADHWIFDATGWISGHSLKHVVASFAAWPVWRALRHRPLAGGT